MRKQFETPDRMISRIAKHQHGIVTYEQLLSAGLVPSAISRRVRAGHLHRLYRGVYAVGHTDLTSEGRWFAAVAACGKGAVLSHQSAAHMWGLSPRSPATIHVTVPGRNGRARRRGIRLHHSRTLTPADTTRRKNIPVTTPERTRRDLGYGPERTRSALERLFLRICHEHGIPKPEVNVRIGPYQVDFLWRVARLVVEVDSYRYHSSRAKFRSDRARDRELGSRGLVVLRFADEELAEEPRATASTLRTHLSKRR
jgi:very-short-patch-repair endonuclease